MSHELHLDPIACTGHGACAELAPELIARDDWGSPILADGPIDPALLAHARRAAAACPTLALVVARSTRPPAGQPGASRRRSSKRGGAA